jgi:hypothetical protein
MAAGGGHKSALRPHVHLSFIKVIKRKDATALIADLEAAVALELEASVPADIIVLCMTHLADHNSSNSQDNLMAYLMKKRVCGAICFCAANAFLTLSLLLRKRNPL